MVNAFQVAGGNVVVRRPNGSIALSTSEPMPAKVGEQTFTVSVDFPNPAGTYTDSRVSGGGFFGDFTIEKRLVVPAANEVVDQVLGGFSGTSTPDIIYGKLTATRNDPYFHNLSGLFMANLVAPDIGSSPVIAWPGGSLLVSICTGNNEPIRIWRHISLKKSGSNWVLEKRQSCGPFATNWAAEPGNGFAQNWTMTINVAWGVLKTGV